MTTELTTTTTGTAIMAAGLVANEYAAGGSFADYLSRKSDNTLRAQRADLATWSQYLCDATRGADCPDPETLQTDPASWRGVTWGLVAGFVRWMLTKGYAVGTVNRHLATVRKYCQLAAQAGVIAPAEAALIHTVQGYGGKDAKRIDERRETCRKGAKKAQNVRLGYSTETPARHPTETQGRGDHGAAA